MAFESVEWLVKEDGQLVSIRPDYSVTSAAGRMRQHGIGCLAVVDDEGRLVGILTERDIIARVVAAGEDPDRVHVADVMTEQVLSCSPDTSIPRAQQLMAAHEIRHLPIVHRGKAIGMVSSRDIMAHQLTTVREIARRQSGVLRDLEHRFPGITDLRRDPTGRVVI